MFEQINYNIIPSFQSLLSLRNINSLNFLDIKEDVNSLYKNNFNSKLNWTNTNVLVKTSSNYGLNMSIDKTDNFKTEGFFAEQNSLCSFECYGIPKNINIKFTNILLDNTIGNFVIWIKNNKTNNRYILLTFNKCWNYISDSISKTYNLFNNTSSHDGCYLFENEIDLGWIKSTKEVEYNINFSNYSNTRLNSYRDSNNTIYIQIPSKKTIFYDGILYNGLDFYLKYCEIIF